MLVIWNATKLMWRQNKTYFNQLCIVHLSYQNQHNIIKCNCRHLGSRLLKKTLEGQASAKYTNKQTETPRKIGYRETKTPFVAGYVTPAAIKRWCPIYRWLVWVKWFVATWKRFLSLHDTVSSSHAMGRNPYSDMVNIAKSMARQLCCWALEL